jgi:hypothetical protein
MDRTIFMKTYLKSSFFFISVVLFFATVFTGCGESLEVRSPDELQKAVLDPPASGIIRIASGTYELSPQDIIDSTCANCQDPTETVPATAGLILSGGKIHLIGPEDHSARINTNAGYGIFFRNCQDGLLENLTITGGTRDEDPRASSAAVIVRKSRVRIINNLISGNIGDSSLVVDHIVGIMGIAGREGAHMEITGNRIIRNSWDGIALYRDANAVIHDNFIDGVDRARGAQAGGGRGVAIGVTWNASAEIKNNYITNYWKGIGIFVDAHAMVENNIIEDLLTWGIAYWDAGKGRPWARITGNIIYNTGACGVNLDAAADTGSGPGCFRKNIIVRTAQNPKYDSPDYYGYQCALSVFEIPADFTIAGNLFFDNRRADPSLPDQDQSRAAFSDSLSAHLAYFSSHPFWKMSNFYKNIVLNSQ